MVEAFNEKYLVVLLNFILAGYKKEGYQGER